VNALKRDITLCLSIISGRVTDLSADDLSFLGINGATNAFRQKNAHDKFTIVNAIVPGDGKKKVTVMTDGEMKARAEDKLSTMICGL